MNITKPCPFCGESQTVVVHGDQLKAYLSGTHVQYAFPQLSADQREVIISGICAPCWETL